MKKALIALLFVATSAFSVSAQFQIGDTKVNVGRVCGTVDGKYACVDPSTGQWQVVDNAGNSVGGNARTGQVGGSTNVGGTRVNGTFGGGAQQPVGTYGQQTSGGFGSTYSGTGSANGNLNGLFNLAYSITNRSVPLLIGVALLAFFWFLIEFIWKGSQSPDAQSQAKKGMFWSILALFVMVSIWGIIGVMGSVLGINQGGSIQGFVLPGESR